MSTNIKITIAESSSIIRCGLETLLKRLPGFRIQISEITAADCLTERSEERRVRKECRSRWSPYH